jgi:uncharacterized membrane protein YdbT with pleckstrin-like domain
MVKIPEKGVKYKTSRIAYIGNYLLAILIIFFLLLLIQKLNLGFFLFPKTLGQVFSTFLIIGFVGLTAYFIEEPVIERIIRHYVVTNNEVIKIEGIIRKKRIAIPYQSVADVRVTKSFVGRVFNFGNVEISGFKDSITMKGMRDPEEIYRIIQNKISRFRGGPRIRKIEYEEE